MENFTRINENICRLTIPYKDIFTTVYTVRTPAGVLLFDTASWDEDVENYLLPFLKEAGVAPEELKYIFVSHNHTDHAGGVKELMKVYPEATILSRSAKLLEKNSRYKGICHQEGDILLEVLQVVTIPGHSRDSMGLLDTRTKTLLSGDCLQLFGIYGSGAWGSNITLPTLHLQALEKLAALPIERIFAAHEYHPLGWRYEGEGVADALENCRKPLFAIRDLIRHDPSRSDEEIAAEISRTLPRLNPRVVAAVREELV
jgi:glyoxylase-like metal-dependent hydrolase (beta-lactamase superfamily II)